MTAPSPPPGMPPNLVVELHTILDRIHLGEWFPAAQPLEVELGSGDGSFLVEYARAHPERNFIGVERLMGRVRKLDRKGRRAGLLNLRGVRIESSYFLEFLLPPEAARAVHVYFPDPWPKARHARHRLVSERFPGIAQRALEPGGVVYLRTDNRPYFEQMEFVFGQAPAFRRTETPAELLAQVTDFEREFRAQGIQTLHAAYQLTRAEDGLHTIL